MPSPSPCGRPGRLGWRRGLQYRRSRVTPVEGRLETAAVDQARYLQLAESLDGFRVKLRERAKTLDVCERQQILRLLVKEVLVAANSLTIRHSIPIPRTGPVPNGPQPKGSYPPGASQKPSYLLRSRSTQSSPGQRVSALCARSLVREKGAATVPGGGLFGAVR
jgi:site-specific DNA recombinase